MIWLIFIFLFFLIVFVIIPAIGMIYDYYFKEIDEITKYNEIKLILEKESILLKIIDNKKITNYLYFKLLKEWDRIRQERKIDFAKNELNKTKDKLSKKHNNFDRLQTILSRIKSDDPEKMFQEYMDKLEKDILE